MSVVHSSLSPHFRAEVEVRNPTLIDVDASYFILQMLNHFLGVEHAEYLASLGVAVVGHSFYDSVGHVKSLFHDLSNVGQADFDVLAVVDKFLYLVSLPNMAVLVYLILNF